MTCKKYIHTIVVCLEKNRIFSPFKKNIIIEYLYFKHISSISVWDPKDPDQIALKIKEWHEVSLFFSKQTRNFFCPIWISTYLIEERIWMLKKKIKNF